MKLATSLHGQSTSWDLYAFTLTHIILSTPHCPVGQRANVREFWFFFSEVFLLFACLWCVISCQLRRKRKEDHDFPRAAQVELVHLEPSQRQRGGGRAEEDRKKVLPPPESASDGPPEQGRQCMQMAIPIRNEV